MITEIGSLFYSQNPTQKVKSRHTKNNKKEFKSQKLTKQKKLNQTKHKKDRKKLYHKKKFKPRQTHVQKKTKFKSHKKQLNHARHEGGVDDPRVKSSVHALGMVLRSESSLPTTYLILLLVLELQGRFL